MVHDQRDRGAQRGLHRRLRAATLQAGTLGDESLLFEGLPRTEAIQERLGQWLAACREAEDIER
jgi:hypothetical protein